MDREVALNLDALRQGLRDHVQEAALKLGEAREQLDAVEEYLEAMQRQLSDR